jgi:hypothetical protein
MAVEPIKFLDSLVTAAILTPYDFVRLTLAGLLIPARTAVRFSWRLVFSILKRLSSLTYLTLWVLIAVSFGLLTDGKLVTRLFGLGETDATTAGTIASALLITMILDLSVRAVFVAIQPRIRRDVYESLARVALGNLFLGALVVMLISGRQGLLSPVFAVVQMKLVGTIPVWYPNIYLFLFSVPLVFVFIKAFAVQKVGKRLALGVAVFLLAPICTTYAAIAGAYLGYQLEHWVSPNLTLAVKQREVKCSFGPQNIRVTGFLTLEGADHIGIRVEDLAVRYSFDGEGSSDAKLADDQPGITVSKSRYTWVDLVARYGETGRNHAGDERSECSLMLSKTPSAADDKPVSSMTDYPGPD